LEQEQGYWGRTLGQRLSRRRAIASTGAAGLGAALLAACGGSDSGGSGGGGKNEPQAPVSSLITQQKDTTKEAKKGGTLKFTVPGDIPNFDAHILSFTDAQQVLLNFSRLTRIKPGVLQPSDGTVIGDAMESWEFSPDKLTLTMKVRPNLGMPQVAPVNGRNLDATDIVYSWDRWVKTGTNRSELANSVKAGAPVLSLTSTDAKTIVIKLKEPVASILTSFSNQASGWLFVYPKEAESGFDMRRNPMGSGVYYISDYAPSTRFVYSRNPNFYDKNTAFADKIEVPIITEYAQGIAQLKAGNLHWYAINADEVLQTKKDVPDLNMYQTDPASLGITSFFGFQPGNGTPFRDVRLRQAWSMSLDRDLYLNTWGNVDKFKAGGVDVPTYWNAALPQTAFKGWWLDPRGKDFGPNATYFKHDLAEAKKLMAAAGFANGLTVASNYVGPEGYGPTTLKHIEVLEGMTSEAGFKFDKKLQSYAGNWMPEFRDSHGYFDGVAYRLTPYPADPGDAMYSAYNKNGGIYYGFDPDGKGTPKGQPFTGDPTCEDLTNKMRTDFDDAKRKQYGQDLQRYLGKMMYQIDSLGAAPGFNLVWPTVKNWLTYHTQDWGQYWPTFWLDDTLPPNKK
jgi:ABC-type transport system substrate-binding protein